MTRQIWTKTLLMAGAMACTLHAWAGPGAHGPNGEHLDEPPGQTTASVGLLRWPDGSVQVPKDAQRRLGIRTVLAPQGTHPTTVQLSARVVMDPRSAGVVQAPVAGHVQPSDTGLPVPGQRVQRGQVLAQIRPAFGVAEQGGQRAQLAEVRAARQLAQQRVDRLQQLDGVIPRKEIDAARTELQGLREREAILSSALASVLPVRAPVSGVLARAHALNGQMVAAQAMLFEIVDPHRFLVEARVSDPSVALQLQGASVIGMPGLQLRLHGVPRLMDDGSVPVLFAATSDAPPALAIGQALTLVASTGARRTGVAVPAESVVRTSNNEPMVWIKVGAERFLPQPVQTVPLGADSVLVLRGLSPDNRVVVQGASLINQIR